MDKSHLDKRDMASIEIFFRELVYRMFFGKVVSWKGFGRAFQGPP